MRRRTLAVTAAAVGGGVLVVAAVVTLAGPDATRSTTPPPLAAPVSAESACGLPGTPGDGTGGAAEARWQTVGAYALPVSTTDGPGNRIQSGPWSCFTRTPSGAVLAGITISVRASGAAENWRDVIRTQTMPGAGQDAALAGSLGEADQVTVRGFTVVAYSPDRATVRYYLHSPKIDASCTTDVQWSGGDWRLVLGEDGSTSSGCSQGAPVSFIPWGP